MQREERREEADIGPALQAPVGPPHLVGGGGPKACRHRWDLSIC
jgi:hypothetical protein